MDVDDQFIFRELPEVNTIEMLGKFKRSKNTILKENQHRADWTDIFAMRQSSMAFTLQQMRKEARELSERQLAEGAWTDDRGGVPGGRSHLTSVERSEDFAKRSRIQGNEQRVHAPSERGGPS